jgi:two-component system phosphate regulon sensor histidine kinase PhoR
MMHNKRLFWSLFPPYFAVATISLLALAVFVCLLFRARYLESLEQNLLAQAAMASMHLATVLEDNPGSLLAEVNNYALVTNENVIVVTADQKVFSNLENATVETIQAHPEITSALRGESRSVKRYDFLQKKNIISAGHPILLANGDTAAVSLSTPLIKIQSILNKVYLTVFASVILLAAIVAGVAWYHSQKVAKPLQAMRRQTERIAKGDFSTNTIGTAREVNEIKELRESLNQISLQMGQRLQTITQQRQLEEAILASMAEGVFAIDINENVLKINDSAITLFNLKSRNDVLGKPIRQVLRSPELIDFVEETITTHSFKEQEITLHGMQVKTLQAHGTPLRNSEGKRIGALLVFNDLTEIQRLQNYRKDFVANVSHELKTPLTSIKGYVETLLSGALEDPKNSRQFLEIMQRHTDRLNSLVEDLLELARLDKAESLDVFESSVSEILHSAADVCMNKAQSKSIAIDIKNDPNLSIKVNAQLIEQALINLIDNAIKYSDEGGRIWIESKRQDTELHISVCDDGIGIPAKHLSRIFDRFYTVDKARSREMGGTGLGLAIVKNAIQSHGGQVKVESTAGEGSCFTLVLPAQNS